MKQFEILVKTIAGSKSFLVRPANHGEDVHYEIWDENRHIFSLECCTGVHNATSLKLTDEFSHKEVYPGLVQALSDVIFRNEKAK
jgi:hypothetical protein